jgi:GDP-L-fucose synthase
MLLLSTDLFIKNMKILLLGHTGFVGQNVYNELTKNVNNKVIGKSRSNGLDLFNLDDICVFLSENQPNIIINCAAHVGSLNFVTQIAADILDDNMRMILNLYKAIQCSSPNSIVINPIANCAFPGNLTEYNEEFLWTGKVHQSVLAYGSSRRMLDVLAECYKMQYGIKSIQLYVPNMYGPFDSTDPNKAHALNALVGKIVRANHNKINEIEVWGSGVAIREWLYAPDFGKVINEILNNLDQNYFSEPFNIAQNFGLSISDLLNIIISECKFTGNINWNRSMPDGAPRKVMADNRFKKNIPNFVFTPLKDGLKETVKYYQSKLPY